LKQEKACLFILILLLVFACQKFEQKLPNEKPLPDVMVDSAVDRAVVTLDDVVQFTITVNADPRIDIDIPEVAKKFSGLRVIDYETDREREENGRKIKRKRYKLKADETGSYLLPAVELSYQTHQGKPPQGGTPQGAPQGDKKTVKTSPIFLEVRTPESLKAGGEDIRDIKPLFIIPYDWRWVIYSVATFFLLGMGLVIWKWVRARRSRPIPLPMIPPDEIALARINALKIQWERREIGFKAMHYGLSEAVRAYLEGRYGLCATDMTLEEIRREMNAVSGLGVSEKPILSELLGQTDRVKFTDYIPSESQSDTLIGLALSFVEATRSKEPVAAAKKPV
jgi:hypothetical protein